jgi:hypothetical protein
MRLFGTLTQQISDNHKETIERIDSLPCKIAACPGEKK